MDKYKAAEVIKKLGGPAALARMLGMEKSKGTQRVFNWTKRGIPWRVLCEHKEIFSSGKG